MKCRNPWVTRVGALLIACAWLSTTVVGAAQSGDVERRRREDAGQAAHEASIEAQRVAANALFVSGDVRGALDALNVIAEPRIDEVKLEGRVRANGVILTDYLGSRSGDLLTWGRLSRLGRHLQDFPAVSSGKVRYDLGDGSAIVRPILFERRRFYDGPVEWAQVGVRSLIAREAVLSASDITGHGEVWTPSVRWASGRPRVALNVAMPAPGVIPGVVHFDALWQSAHFDSRVPGAASGVEEDRGRVGASVSDWLTGWLRWEGGAAVDRIATVAFVSLNGNVNLRAFNDHVATVIGGAWYNSASNRTATGNLAVSARSTTRDDRFVVTTRAGVAVAGETAPLSLWPMAGTGGEPFAPLRAHSPYESGILTSDVFGRRLAFATAESVYPLPTRLGPTFLGLAGFIDAAQTWSGLAGSRSPMHVDVGTGIRVNTSRSGGRLRVDVAYGLQDGRVHLSAGYVQPWGKR